MLNRVKLMFDLVSLKFPDIYTWIIYIFDTFILITSFFLTDEIAITFSLTIRMSCQDIKYILEAILRKS